MNIILFDHEARTDLLPLTFTRPVCELRTGILTIREKWEKRFNISISFLTEAYLSIKYPMQKSDDNLLINGGLLPDEKIFKAVANLEKNTILKSGNTLLAARVEEVPENISAASFKTEKEISFAGDTNIVESVWQIFVWNGSELKKDFALLTKNRSSASLSNTNRLLSPENIFVEKGAKAEFATINASSGPVFISKNAEIMENSAIRGPFFLGEESVVKMGAKIYGPTTIGPFSKVGGEINNSVFFGYSNKAHDGFLGNSVIGEWCNIGADSNNSNLKNNYAEVRLWNYNEEKFVNTGLQFCGLIMGDHSKCGINTMFNTGTVVGVNANIFGSGFPRNFIPSFSWGGAHGMTTYSTPKAFEVAEKVMQRRNIEFTEADKDILKEIFSETRKYRN